MPKEKNKNQIVEIWFELKIQTLANKRDKEIHVNHGKHISFSMVPRK